MAKKTETAPGTIVERVKKLLTMANHDGTPTGEATNSMRLAQRLMDKYGIDLSDLSEAEIQDRVVQMTVKLTYAKWQGWHNALIAGLQKAFQVKVILTSWHDPKAEWGTPIKKGLIVIGQECDVEVAMYFWDYLCNRLYYAGDDDAKTLGLTRKDKTAHRTDFIIGAIRSIAKRLEDDRQAIIDKDKAYMEEILGKGDADTRAPDSDKFAMVLVKKGNAIEAFVKQTFKDLKSVPMPGGGGSWEGHRRGQEYGSKVDLNKGLDGSKKPDKALKG